MTKAQKCDIINRLSHTAAIAKRRKRKADKRDGKMNESSKTFTKSSLDKNFEM